MTGLVAVVALDRAVGVTDEDLEPLLRAYESLRGPSARTTRLAGGTVVRAARLEGVAGCPSGAARRPPADRPRTGSAVAEECLFIGRPSTSDGTVPGLRNLADADGQFALIGYDRVAEDVVVATDPFGMVALYVTEHRGRAYVSTSSLALAVLVKAPAERLAVQSFLLSGYHFGTGNHWRGVERLQPSTAVRYTPDGRTSQRLWRPQPDDAVRRLRLPEAVDHCIEVAVADLERMRGEGDVGGSDRWVRLTPPEPAAVAFGGAGACEHQAHDRPS